MGLYGPSSPFAVPLPPPPPPPLPMATPFNPRGGGLQNGLAETTKGFSAITS